MVQDENKTILKIKAYEAFFKMNKQVYYVYGVLTQNYPSSHATLSLMYFCPLFPKLLFLLAFSSTTSLNLLKNLSFRAMTPNPPPPAFLSYFLLQYCLTIFFLTFLLLCFPKFFLFPIYSILYLPSIPVCLNPHSSFSYSSSNGFPLSCLLLLLQISFVLFSVPISSLQKQAQTNSDQKMVIAIQQGSHAHTGWYPK